MKDSAHVSHTKIELAGLIDWLRVFSEVAKQELSRNINSENLAEAVRKIKLSFELKIQDA